MSNVKENILAALRSIKREHINDVIEYMLKHGFFDRGCHGHHKYVGGLAGHAWQTFLFAKDAEDDACHCHLRYIVHYADGLSAKSYKYTISL